jgi:NAD+ kinase
MTTKEFYLFANPGKPETVAAVKALADALLEKGCGVLLDTWLFERLSIGRPCAIQNIDSSLCAIITFGGDGTLLRTLPSAAAKGVPVLGVNMGHTGFLLETDPHELLQAIDRLIQGRYAVEERMMLRCIINGEFTALVMNEAALTRGQNPSSLVVDVLTGDERVFSIHGDGVMVSTPTGTTGYSLSAGGPVIHPSIYCQVIVPISSHIMHHRPVVLPKDSIIRLKVMENRGRMHQVSIDGQIVMDLTTDTEIVIQAADTPARFIRFSEQKFLTRLQQKQTEWSNHAYGGNL